MPLAAKEDPDGNADLVGFDVAEVEAYGLGGQQALVEQEKKKEYEVKEAMKRRQVNKKIMLGGEEEDGGDMWMLEMAGAHQSYVKGEEVPQRPSVSCH